MTTEELAQQLLESLDETTWTTGLVATDVEENARGGHFFGVTVRDKEFDVMIVERGV